MSNFKLNPNASSFVPSWAQQPPPAAAKTAPTNPAQTTIPPTRVPETRNPPPPAQETATSWEDEDTTPSQVTNTAPTGQQDAPQKPTESVFVVEEDDIEEDDTAETAAEVQKLQIAETPAIEEDTREHLNLVFIGHVDAGKSTISGQIMLLTGQVDERTLQKYEKEAKENNRESWIFAYIMDTNEEERAKGKTVEVGRAHFETKAKRYTILDAPGHKNYVPNMIGGAAQADVAILVISARKGEFEAGFDKGGQTREHARLVKTIGVKHLLVVINKMDDPNVNWSKERFDECVDKLTPFLKATGYNVKKDITFIPMSGYTGANMLVHSTKEMCPWYDGPTFFSYLDNLPPVERKVDAPLRIPIVDSFKDRGLTVVMGKIEAGTLVVGQTVFLMPGKVALEVVGINTETHALQKAKPGENVKVTVRGIEEGNVSAGLVLCDNQLVPCLTEFEVMLAVHELSKEKSLLTAGYEAVLHLHTCVEECTISDLISQVDTKTNQESKKKPTFVKSNSVVRCRLQTAKPVPVESFTTLPQLGRFTLRDGGRTIAMGKVTSIAPKKAGK
jgi:peptide chain release factor subunit 3